MLLVELLDDARMFECSVDGEKNEVDVVELVIVAQRGGVMVCRSSCRSPGENFSRCSHMGDRRRLPQTFVCALRAKLALS